MVFLCFLGGIENKSKVIKNSDIGSNSKLVFNSVYVKNFAEFKKTIFKKLADIDSLFLQKNCVKNFNFSYIEEKI